MLTASQPAKESASAGHCRRPTGTTAAPRDASDAAIAYPVLPDAPTTAIVRGPTATPQRFRAR